MTDIRRLAQITHEDGEGPEVCPRHSTPKDHQDSAKYIQNSLPAVNSKVIRWQLQQQPDHFTHSQQQPPQQPRQVLSPQYQIMSDQFFDFDVDNDPDVAAAGTGAPPHGTDSVAVIPRPSSATTFQNFDQAAYLASEHLHPADLPYFTAHEPDYSGVDHPGAVFGSDDPTEDIPLHQPSTTPGGAGQEWDLTAWMDSAGYPLPEAIDDSCCHNKENINVLSECGVVVPSSVATNHVRHHSQVIPNPNKSTTTSLSGLPPRAPSSPPRLVDPKILVTPRRSSNPTAAPTSTNSQSTLPTTKASSSHKSGGASAFQLNFKAARNTTTMTNVAPPKPKRRPPPAASSRIWAALNETAPAIAGVGQTNGDGGNSVGAGGAYPAQYGWSDLGGLWSANDAMEYLHQFSSEADFVVEALDDHEWQQAMVQEILPPLGHEDVAALTAAAATPVISADVVVVDEETTNPVANVAGLQDSSVEYDTIGMRPTAQPLIAPPSPDKDFVAVVQATTAAVTKTLDEVTARMSTPFPAPLTFLSSFSSNDPGDNGGFAAATIDVPVPATPKQTVRKEPSASIRGGVKSRFSEYYIGGAPTYLPPLFKPAASDTTTTYKTALEPQPMSLPGTRRTSKKTRQALKDISGSQPILPASDPGRENHAAWAATPVVSFRKQIMKASRKERMADISERGYRKRDPLVPLLPLPPLQPKTPLTPVVPLPVDVTPVRPATSRSMKGSSHTIHHVVEDDDDVGPLLPIKFEEVDHMEALLQDENVSPMTMIAQAAAAVAAIDNQQYLVDSPVTRSMKRKRMSPQKSSATKRTPTQLHPPQAPNKTKSPSVLTINNTSTTSNGIGLGPHEIEAATAATAATAAATKLQLLPKTSNTKKARVDGMKLAVEKLLRTSAAARTAVSPQEVELQRQAAEAKKMEALVTIKQALKVEEIVREEMIALRNAGATSAAGGGAGGIGSGRRSASLVATTNVGTPRANSQPKIAPSVPVDEERMQNKTPRGRSTTNRRGTAQFESSSQLGVTDDNYYNYYDEQKKQQQQVQQLQPLPPQPVRPVIRRGRPVKKIK